MIPRLRATAHEILRGIRNNIAKIASALGKTPGKTTSRIPGRHNPVPVGMFIPVTGVASRSKNTVDGDCDKA
jgi:hypothetical protein